MNALTAPNARKNLDFFVITIRWKKHRDRPTDHQVGGIIEQSLRPVIPCRDDAVQLYTDDSIIRRVDDRGQSLISHLRLLALDQVCCLSSQYVQEAQVTF